MSTVLYISGLIRDEEGNLILDELGNPIYDELGPASSTVSLSEEVLLEFPTAMLVFDAATVTDVPTVAVEAALDIDITLPTETVTVTDVEEAAVQAATSPQVFAQESLDISDAPAVERDLAQSYSVEVFDSLDVTDSVGMHLRLDVSVADSLTVEEDHTVVRELAVDRDIEVYDEATLGSDPGLEVLVVAVGEIAITVSSSTDLADAPSLGLELALEVSAEATPDEVTVTDEGQAAIMLANRLSETHDELTLLDGPVTTYIHPAVDIDLPRWDAVAVTDIGQLFVHDPLADIDITTFDLVTVTDVRTVYPPFEFQGNWRLSELVGTLEVVGGRLRYTHHEDGTGLIHLPAGRILEAGSRYAIRLRGKNQLPGEDRVWRLSGDLGYFSTDGVLETFTLTDVEQSFLFSVDTGTNTALWLRTEGAPGAVGYTELWDVTVQRIYGRKTLLLPWRDGLVVGPAYRDMAQMAEL